MVDGSVMDVVEVAMGGSDSRVGNGGMDVVGVIDVVVVVMGNNGGNSVCLVAAHCSN